MRKYAAEHDRLSVFQPPSHAPDLNPVAYFFGAARRRTPPSRTRTTSSERSPRPQTPPTPAPTRRRMPWPGPD
ncbi:hypothetical protein OG609_07350 [Streptomyces sp. NBC_01224]|nr:hypothetical protein OG609_07350 [Streptomyces sp. NBC_01224]